MDAPAASTVGVGSACGRAGRGSGRTGRRRGLRKRASQKRELRSFLLLAAMSFILLPMLPDRTIDPWDTVNPFEMWLLTVMIAAISFAGYIAIKAAGDKAGKL
jgi:uncharacterized membrane protein (DUF4010 family)